MRRNRIEARPDWENIVAKQGLTYYRTKTGPYWNESAYYSFTSAEVDALEAATNTLQEMCLQAGQYIIDNKLWNKFAIPLAIAELIVHAWNDEPPAIYGRFDLSYDGYDIKMLEYNADTPTALIEAAVIQWYWLQDKFPYADQFNSIHERLIAKWKELKDYVKQPLHFTYLPDDTGEDLMTITYMMDTASQAGHNVDLIRIPEIGYCNDCHEFVDLNDDSLLSIFKLYPWEWLIHEEFGKHLTTTYGKTQWIEPIWKMMWSNKAILPILWEMYPNHQFLLPAFFESDKNFNPFTEFPRGFVRKPLLSREGANVTLVSPDGMNVVSTAGEYGEEGYVVQARAKIANLDGFFPVIGSWVIDGVSAGIGIRESVGPVTDNTSCFVPHLFK